MEYELTLPITLLLLAVGVLSGFINTLAGGGSIFTLPTLMLLGMPADVANATNRVGVVAQSVTGAKGFFDLDRLDTRIIFPALMPTVLGALGGALLASWMPVWVLKPVLLSVLIALALVILVKPATVAPEPGTPRYTVKERPLAAVGLFFSGVYGGFVHAGVGFMLIATLTGVLRYDLVRANALKTVCTAAFSSLALLVFALQGQVWWLPGAVIAVGSIFGAMMSVRFAIRVSQNTLKWILFVMVTVSCIAAWLSGGLTE